MPRSRLRARTLVGLLAVTMLGSHGAAQAAPRIYYVDFDGGNDNNDGLSPTSPWKHAPGDPNFKNGTARLFALAAGDVVRFRGGVRYRGSFMPRANGTAEAKVVLDGSSWGSTRAILDGSDPVSDIRRCRSAADCLGSPHWQNLWRASIPATANWSDGLFINDMPAQAAQWPEVAARDASDINKFQTIPKAAYAQLLAGSISHALPPGMAFGTPVLALWNRPNKIGFTPDVRISSEGLAFAGAKWTSANFDPYPDRDNRFAILNAPAFVNRPGLAALSPADEVAIFWPVMAREVKVRLGTPRDGINLARAKHMVVRGFSFTNYDGLPIVQKSSNEGNVIRDNSFRSLVRTTAIWTVAARDLTIFRNEFRNLVWSAGLKIDNTRGPVMIRCNQMSDVTQTGIRFNNVANGTIRGNSITGILGNHANGISAYNDSRNVVIDHNVVKDAARPFTTHGTSTFRDYEGTPSVRVSNNIFLSNSRDGAGLTSYGKTPDFVITGNFLSGPRFAMKLAGTETGFVATGNQLVGSVAISRKGMIEVLPDANQMHNADGNGLLLAEEMAKAKVNPAVCTD